MARSDFNLVPIRQKFTTSNPSVTKQFRVEGTDKPIDDAYLLIQVRGVNSLAHNIKINGKSLAGADLPPAPNQSQAWLTWLEHVPPDFLKAGTNSIEIERKDHDDFEIRNIVVNWREPE